MNYKKMWVTLKAESGYRETHPLNLTYVESQTIRELMERQEKIEQKVNER